MPSSGRSNREAIRLNRFLAQLGVGSRRQCDEIIAAGRVHIDGKKVREAGVRVVPGVQRVSVDGTPVDRPSRPIVLLLNKPTGVVSTVSDPQGRPTVIDLCGKFARNRRLFPVGRLDINTTGALLVTNDGLLCYRLTHPRFGIARTYQVRVRGGFDERKLARLRRMATEGTSPGRRGRGGRDATGSGPRGKAGRRGGQTLRGKDASKRDAARRQESAVTVVRELDKITVLRITLHEGRNRQVRRMCEAVGLHVVKLKRESFGPVSIRKLPAGTVRPLERREVEKLYNLTKSGDDEHGSVQAG